MRIGIHGRNGVVYNPLVLLAVTSLLLTVAMGCGTRQAERAAAQSQDTAEPPQTPEKAEPKAAPSTATQSAAKGHEGRAAQTDAKPSGVTSRVRLTPKGCVEFDPRWANIRMGQSLTWQSELKSPVTIHVTPGVFDRSEFVVRPGAVVSTGPSRSPGSYTMWTEPASCQSAPSGVKGSGPGVIVDALAQR